MPYAYFEKILWLFPLVCLFDKLYWLIFEYWVSLAFPGSLHAPIWLQHIRFSISCYV